MGIVIQKFGGTSVRDPGKRDMVAEWVASAVHEGKSPVVVVSAMGRGSDPYSTDSLLALLSSFPEIPANERDLVASCGEIISSVVLAGHLRKRGLEPVVLSGGQAGIVTDETYGDAQIIEIDPERLRHAVQQNKVPVVAGFQGRTQGGQVTTLGRGGSDTTAVALGAALAVEVVEIFTDVDGIKTADPRIVPEARTISRLDYDEVFQLANLGARVIHPRAVEIARQFSVPVRIRSTFSPSAGTLVAPGRRTMDPWAHRHPDRAVTGITQLEHLVQFRVEAPDESAGSWAYYLFDRLGSRGVSVDLINLYPTHAYFCVPEATHRQTLATLEELGYRSQMNRERAKVSIIGSAIQGLPGVVGRVMAALTQASVEVFQSSDSHSTITLLLKRSDMEKAVKALHVQFGLAEEVEKP